MDLFAYDRSPQEALEHVRRNRCLREEGGDNGGGGGGGGGNDGLSKSGTLEQVMARLQLQSHINQVGLEGHGTANTGVFLARVWYSVLAVGVRIVVLSPFHSIRPYDTEACHKPYRALGFSPSTSAPRPPRRAGGTIRRNHASGQGYRDVIGSPASARQGSGPPKRSRRRRRRS